MSGSTIDTSTIDSSTIDSSTSDGAGQHILRQMAAEIEQQGVLAHSRRLQQLFQYLLQCSLNGHQPKEVEVAIEGLGQRSDFDTSIDSMVRVHMHKLRKTLAQVQTSLPWQLCIPRGEYKLLPVPLQTGAHTQPAQTLDTTREQPLAPNRRRHWQAVTTGFVLLLSLVLLWSQRPPSSQLQQLLAPFAGQQTVLLVLGDYYVFAEADNQGQVGRLVRDFKINSSVELLQQQQLQPELASQQFDLGLSYLPVSIALPLLELTSQLQQQGVRYQVVFASQLQEFHLQQPLIYLGQLSGQGLLGKRWQQLASYRQGDSFDVLIGADGQHYRTASPMSPPDLYPNYSYVLASHADAVPQLWLTGLRDEGLLALRQWFVQAPTQPSHQGSSDEWLLDVSAGTLAAQNN